MTEIIIYGDIGENLFGDGVTAKSVKAQLDDASGDISVRLNSPGGDVFEGFAIYNLLDQHDGNVEVTVDGMAASAASVVMMAGSKITMSANSLAMIHDPWTLSVGGADDMRATADLLDKVKASIITTYMTRTSLPESTVMDMMRAETWFNANEAIAHGFAHEVAQSNQAAAYNTAKPWIKNAPTPEKLPEDIETQAAYRVAMARRRLSIDE